MKRNLAMSMGGLLILLTLQVKFFFWTLLWNSSRIETVGLNLPISISVLRNILSFVLIYHSSHVVFRCSSRCRWFLYRRDPGSFNDVFPLLFQIIATSRVLTNNIDFSSWSCHSIYQECIKLTTIINYRISGHYQHICYNYAAEV